MYKQTYVFLARQFPGIARELRNLDRELKRGNTRANARVLPGFSAESVKTRAERLNTYNYQNIFFCCITNSAADVNLETEAMIECFE